MQFNNIKSFLASIEMTIKEFAELLGYSQTHIYAVFAGQAKLSEELEKKIMECTNGSVDLDSMKKKSRNRKRKASISKESLDTQKQSTSKE